MIAKNAVRKLLEPFDISISDETIDKLIVYADLLLRWNQKINLTSISSAEECITRHFGECFLLSRTLELRGRLLDVGSGAGFPGLALKLLAPSLEVVLLEPVGKKRAFLKEVSRACSLGSIQVNGSRLDEFARANVEMAFDIISARAVGGLTSLIIPAKGLLNIGGHLCLWVGRQQVQEIREACSGLDWWVPEAIPLSHERVILVGTRPERNFA